MEWIWRKCTWSVYLKHVNHFTHVLHVFFADFDERCSSRCVLDLARRLRKQGGQYYIVAGNEGRIPESASLDVIWAPLLKLSTEAIPKPSTIVVELCVGEDTEYPDYCQSRGSR